VGNRDLILVSKCRYPFVEEPIFSPIYVFATFVKNQMIIAAWVYFWAL
jgi:hypothetical protein